MKILSLQVLAAIGGIFSLVGGGWGFWSFVFWSTVIISGLLLGLKVFGILQTLEGKFAWFNKVVSVHSAVYRVFLMKLQNTVVQRWPKENVTSTVLYSKSAKFILVEHNIKVQPHH